MKGAEWGHCVPGGGGEGVLGGVASCYCARLGELNLKVIVSTTPGGHAGEGDTTSPLAGFSNLCGAWLPQGGQHGLSCLPALE